MTMMTTTMMIMMMMTMTTSTTMMMMTMMTFDGDESSLQFNRAFDIGLVMTCLLQSHAPARLTARRRWIGEIQGVHRAVWTMFQRMKRNYFESRRAPHLHITRVTRRRPSLRLVLVGFFLTFSPLVLMVPLGRWHHHFQSHDKRIGHINHND